MFAFLKKFGRKGESAPAPAPAALPGLAAHTNGHAAHANGSATLVETPPPAAPARTVMPRTSSRNATGAESSAIPSAPRQSAPPSRIAERPAAPAVPAVPALIIELPLKQLWHKLNPEVLKLATGHPEGSAVLRIPFPLLHAQLAKGAVRIPYVQLRQFSPEGLFPALPDKDALEIDIPIAEVLPHLKPEHLARRPNQKKIEVPDEIGPIFGPNGGPGGNLRVLEAKPQAPARPAANGAANGAAVPPLPPVPSPAIAPAAMPSPAPVAFRPEAPIPAPAAKPIPAPGAAPIPVSAPIPAKIPAPNLPAPGPIPAPRLPLPSPIAPPSAAPRPATASVPSPIPAPRTVAPAIPNAPAAPLPASAGPNHANHANHAPIPAPRLDPGLATLRAKPLEGTFNIALMDLAAFWTEKGQDELANLYRHSLEIPMSTLESSLKSGKLHFLWREVRPWVRLASGNTLPTLPDDLAVELPLAIIAPRFMEQRGLVKPVKRVEVSDEIPDVFEVKQTAPELNGAALPEAAGGSESNTAFITAAMNGRPFLEFGEIFGQPDKKDWTMAEVTQKTLGLRGVAGAILATSDGLLVAGNWPGQAKGESVAAFVPQMYNRMLQYTKELQLGEPGNFTLTIENTPLQIFKTGNSYLTVLGRAGENLPKAQLNAVALRLAASPGAK